VCDVNICVVVFAVAECDWTVDRSGANWSSPGCLQSPTVERTVGNKRLQTQAMAAEREDVRVQRSTATRTSCLSLPHLTVLTT
jgi:hypothetical protein